jgi:hypothetical protein
MSAILDDIIYDWIRSFGVKISSSYLKETLRGHPDYPSLLAVKETLTGLGIENIAMVVDKNKLDELSTPFLAHTQDKGVILVTDKQKLLKTYPDFIASWDGIVIVAEAEALPAIQKNSQYLAEDRRRRLYTVIALALVIAFSAAALAMSFSFKLLTLLFTCFAGLYVSYLIVQRELGISNNVTEKLCGGGSSDCNKVIHSKKAVLFGAIKWSDMGLIYFASYTLYLVTAIFTNTTAAVIVTISLLSLLSVPVILLSLFFQKFILKNWCTLCLLLVSLLIVQASLLSSDIRSLSFPFTTWQSAVLFMFLFVTTGSIWISVVKEFLAKNLELEKRLWPLLRFRRDPNVFSVLMDKRQAIDHTPWETDMQLGNPRASLQIIAACGPYCSPCAEAHKQLDELLDIYGDKIGITIRFIIDKHVQEVTRDAISHMLTVHEGYRSTLSAVECRKQTRKLLNDWYELMSAAPFKERYPLPDHVSMPANLESLKQWTITSKVIFTPTILINGKSLPAPYRVSDLHSLVGFMINETPIDASANVTQANKPKIREATE